MALWGYTNVYNAMSFQKITDAGCADCGGRGRGRGQVAEVASPCCSCDTDQFPPPEADHEIVPRGAPPRPRNGAILRRRQNDLTLVWAPPVTDFVYGKDSFKVTVSLSLSLHIYMPMNTHAHI